MKTNSMSFDYGEYMNEIFKMESQGFEDIRKYILEAVKKVSDDVEECIKLAMTLNHCAWNAKSREAMNFYSNMYHYADGVFMDKLSDEELERYFEVLD